MKGTIVHVTSVHRRFDTRIFVKMCCSIARNGYRIILLVADGEGSEIRDGVQIVDVGRPSGRIDRIFNITRKVYMRALEFRADLYHLHDPELLPMGARLKRAGYRVIFDSHEDVPLQLLAKDYMSPFIRRLISMAYGHYETMVCKKLDGIISATSLIQEKFLQRCNNVQEVANYPILDELLGASERWDIKDKQICYVGSIGRARGIEQMCSAMQHVKSDVFLNLVGPFDDEALHEKVAASPGWIRVIEYGLLDRSGVHEVLQRSLAGLVVLHPITNYMDALPIKMFEYMSAGIPVIASDFPAWREIVAGNDCGFLVNPMDPIEIADSIDLLVSNLGLAKRLGDNGRRAVELKYSWATEEKKLFDFYERILSV